MVDTPYGILLCDLYFYREKQEGASVVRRPLASTTYGLARRMIANVHCIECKRVRKRRRDCAEAQANRTLCKVLSASSLKKLLSDVLQSKESYPGCGRTHAVAALRAVHASGLSGGDGISKYRP